MTLDSAWSSVNGTILTGPLENGFNYIGNATAVAPKPVDLGGKTKPSQGKSWSWSVPGSSITVLQFNLS